MNYVHTITLKHTHTCMMTGNQKSEETIAKHNRGHMHRSDVSLGTVRLNETSGLENLHQRASSNHRKLVQVIREKGGCLAEAFNAPGVDQVRSPTHAHVPYKL